MIFFTVLTGIYKKFHNLANFIITWNSFCSFIRTVGLGTSLVFPVREGL